MKEMPTLHDAYKARCRIKSMIRETPVIDASEMATRTGAKSVHLKMECLQHTGAFKVRGAANKILSLGDEAKQRGVITFSTGNHGKAVAYVAGRAGIRAIICLSEHVAAYRAEMIRNLGAEVAVKGHSQDEAEKNYRTLMKARGLIPVVPLLISEEEIKDGMLYLFETHRTIVEGAAAVGVGAMLNGRVNMVGSV